MLYTRHVEPNNPIIIVLCNFLLYIRYFVPVMEQIVKRTVRAGRRKIRFYAFVPNEKDGSIFLYLIVIFQVIFIIEYVIIHYNHYRKDVLPLVRVHSSAKSILY
jgi:hypothetical protein